MDSIFCSNYSPSWALTTSCGSYWTLDFLSASKSTILWYTGSSLKRISWSDLVRKKLSTSVWFWSTAFLSTIYSDDKLSSIFCFFIIGSSIKLSLGSNHDQSVTVLSSETLYDSLKGLQGRPGRLNLYNGLTINTVSIFFKYNSKFEYFELSGSSIYLRNPCFLNSLASNSGCYLRQCRSSLEASLIIDSPHILQYFSGLFPIFRASSPLTFSNLSSIWMSPDKFMSPD